MTKRVRGALSDFALVAGLVLLIVWIAAWISLPFLLLWRLLL